MVVRLLGRRQADATAGESAITKRKQENKPFLNLEIAPFPGEQQGSDFKLNVSASPGGIYAAADSSFILLFVGEFGQLMML